MLYPYSFPQILNDSIFTTYGGSTGTSSVAQRQAAYTLAEEQMVTHISSFLTPTIVSGSAWYRGRTLFETEYGNIQRVLLFAAEEVRQNNPIQTQYHTGSVMVRNAHNGYLDIVVPCYYGNIYSNLVVYESGFPTGSITQPSMLQGLVIAAQINLNEMDISLANEGTADVGVQSFSNQSYSESRTKLGTTAFGNSAMAQRAARLTRKYKCKSGARLF